MKRIFILLLLLVAMKAEALVPEDIYGIRTTSVVDLSPDGRYLLYTIGSWIRDAEARSTTMYRRDLDTGEDLVMFTPEDRSGGATWRPDGQAIAYLRKTDAGTEIWLMAADGADRHRISQGAGNFGPLIWAPDGSALAWISDAQVQEYEGVRDRVVVADNLGYRHLKKGYRHGNLGQLFVMDLVNASSRRLVDGPVDVREASWSPDSQQLVYAAKVDSNLGLNLNTDLFVVGRTGGSSRQITVNPGMDSDPRWLPDGRIAWVRATEPLWESAPRVIVTMPGKALDETQMEVHGQNLDAHFWRWCESGGRFFALAANGGALDLVELRGEKTRWLTDFQHDFWSVEVAGHRAVLQGAGQSHPGAIFQVDLAEKTKGPHRPVAIIDPNEDWINRVGLTPPEGFQIQVGDREIEGWYFLPEGIEEGQRIPVVLSIHGGPEWMYGGYFLPEFHILPRFGYGVIIANPTGSLGYGTEFQKDIRGDWVDRPARELNACLDWSIEQGWADPDRMAVMGGSYGGHLAAALTTQGDRFRAAAVDRMYPDLVSFWGTTDEKWFPEWEFEGRPWDEGAHEVYVKNSPWYRVDQVNTPTLISHGHLDYRCLAAGGQMWFSALQAQGVPSRFIRFEHEGHGIRDPRNQVFYQHQLLSWFEKYVLEVDMSNGDSVLHD